MVIKQPVNQIRLTNVSIVRYRKGNNNFELACYPNKVQDWREGKESDISQVLQSDKIFSNVGKGQFVREFELLAAFETTEWHTCVSLILKHGEVQLSTQERAAQHEIYVKDVMKYAAQKLVAKTTGLPVTVEQIERASGRVAAFPKNTKQPTKVAGNKVAFKLATQLSEEFCVVGLRVIMNFVNPTECAAMKPKVERELLRMITVIQEEWTPSSLDLYTFSQEAETVESFVAQHTNITVNSELIRAIPTTVIDGYLEAKKQRNIDEQNRNIARKAAMLKDPVGDIAEHIAIPELPITVSMEMSQKQRKQHEKLRLMQEKATERALQEASNLEKVAKRNRDKLEREQAEKDAAAMIFGANPVLPTLNESAPRCECCQAHVDSFRAHAKSSWHLYNQKRQVKNLHPISQRDFDELHADLVNGYLAVDI